MNTTTSPLSFLHRLGEFTVPRPCKLKARSKKKQAGSSKAQKTSVDVGLPASSGGGGGGGGGSAVLSPIAKPVSDADIGLKHPSSYEWQRLVEEASNVPAAINAGESYLGQQLRQANEEKKKAVNRANHLQLDLEREQLSRNSLEGRLKHAQDTLREKGTACARLQERLEQLPHLESKIELLERQVSRDRTRLADYEAECTKLLTRNGVLSAERELATGRADKAKTDLSGEVARIRKDCEEKLTQASSKVAGYDHKIRAATDARVAAEAKAHKAAAEADKANTELAKLRTELNVLRTRVQGLTKTTEALEAEKTSTLGMLMDERRRNDEEMQTQQELVDSRNGELLAQLDEATRNTTRLQQKVAKHKALVKERSAELAEVRELRDRKNEECMKQNTAITSWRLRTTELETEQERLKDTISQLQEEAHEAAKVQGEKQDSTVRRLKENLATLERAKASAEERCTQVSESLDKAQAEVVELSSQLHMGKHDAEISQVKHEQRVASILEEKQEAHDRELAEARRVERLEEKLVQAEQEKQSLRRKNEEVQATLFSESEHLDTEVSRTRTLQSERDEARRSLEVMEQGMRVMEQRLEADRRSFQALSAHHSVLQDTVAGVDREAVSKLQPPPSTASNVPSLASLELTNIARGAAPQRWDGLLGHADDVPEASTQASTSRADVTAQSAASLQRPSRPEHRAAAMRAPGASDEEEFSSDDQTAVDAHRRVCLFYLCVSCLFSRLVPSHLHTHNRSCGRSRTRAKTKCKRLKTVCAPSLRSFKAIPTTSCSSRHSHSTPK